MRRRTFLAGAAGVVAAASIPARAEAAPTVTGALATGLDIPWGLAFLPDGSGLVTERDSGRLLRVTSAGTTTVVTTVSGVSHGGEGGLLGLAVSPDYATDQRVYFYYSADDGNRVAWATYDGTALSSLTTIVDGIPHGAIHNGGSLLFDPHKRLLIGCGESGRPGLAQNLKSLGGKVLRVTMDGEPTLSVTNRDPRIMTWGHRNPEGLSLWRSGTAVEVWCAELGWNTWDELNHIVLGHNYGWPRAEGTDGPGGYTDPFTQWHPADCSPSGISIAGDRAFIGALRGESLWAVDLHGLHAGRRRRFFQGVYGRMRNVKVAPDGSLWVTTANGGGADQLLRMTIGRTGG